MNALEKIGNKGRREGGTQREKDEGRKMNEVGGEKEGRDEKGGARRIHEVGANERNKKSVYDKRKKDGEKGKVRRNDRQKEGCVKERIERKGKRLSGGKEEG